MPATLTIEVTLDTRDIERAANDVRQKVAGAFNGAAGSNALQSGLAQAALKLKEIGRMAKQAGKALTTSLTLPVVGLGAAVIKVGFEFEKSMNDLRAATKASGDELARATKLAKDLGNDLSLPAISANDAASAMTTLAKAGLSLEQSMQAIKGTLQLASAAQIDAAKAAEIQSDAINTFKLAATDAGRVADLLAASANSTSGEITDVAFALKQTGAAAAVLKIPIEDTVTALGLLAQSGVRGSDAGTSLKTALIQLTNPTAKAQAAMEKLGLSFFDAQGRLKPLRDLVDEYSTKTANLTDQQKLQLATTLAGTDGQRALNLVLGAGAEQYDKLKKATTEAGAAQALAAAKAQGGVGAWEAFKSALETLALSLFDIVKGPLIAVLQVLNNLVQFLNDLPRPVQTIIVVVATLAAAIGPLLVALGSVLSAGSAIAALFGTTLTITLSGLAEVILPVIAVLAALGAGAFALYKAWQTNFLGLRDLAQQAFAGITAFVQTQFVEVKKQFDDILPLLKQTTANALAAIQQFWASHGQQIIAIVKSLWEVVQTIVSTGIKLLGNSIKLVLAVINGDWKTAWEAAKTIVLTWQQAFFALLTGLAKYAFNQLKLVGSIVVEALLFLPRKTLEIGGQIIQGLVNGIAAGAQLVYAKIKEIAVGALQAAKAVLGISSPSKEFALLGQFVGAGFVQGLGQSQASVTQAIRKLIGENLKSAKDEVARLTAEIGALLAVTPKQFQADAEIEQLTELKDKLKEILALQKELGLPQGFSGARALGVDRELARLQIQKRLQAGGPVLDVSLPASDFTDPLQQQWEAQQKLDEKLADFARTLQITREAANNYERALAAINGELAGLDDTQKDQLLFFANQKDAYEQAQRQAEQLQQKVTGIAKDVASSLTNIFTAFVKDGFKGGLKAIGNELKTFANTLLKNILGGLASNIANSIVGKLFGGVSLQGTSTNSGGGLLGGLLGGLFGAPGGTAPFAGTSSGGGVLGSIFGGLFSGGGSLSAPPSATGGTRGVLSALGLSGLGSANNRGSALANLFGGVSGLFKGFGFNAKAGSAAPGSLASLAPLLGLSLGAGLGGQSRLGQIVGGAGGALLGIGLTAVPTALAGATTGLAGATAALFSNPITAAVGGVLLIGSFLLGKAKQRKADEAKVDTYWVEYMNVLKELTARVNADRINGDDALAQAAEARSTAIELISQIKTKSVRESRLAHQIPDVDRLFLEPLKEAVERQRKRGARVNQLIPEFAVGGIVPGIDVGRDSVLAWLRPGEVVLTKQHQARLGGDRTFAQIGVPGFAQGGKVEVIERFSAAAASSMRLELDLNVGLRVDETGEIVVAGLRTQRGQNATLRARRINRLNREEM